MAKVRSIEIEFSDGTSKVVATAEARALFHQLWEMFGCQQAVMFRPPDSWDPEWYKQWDPTLGPIAMESMGGVPDGEPRKVIEKVAVMQKGTIVR